MLAVLVMLIIIVASVGHQYLKGSLFQAFIMIIAAILGSIISFNWFEVLTPLLLNRGYGGQWAHALIFIVLFMLSFAILQSIAFSLVKVKISFSDSIDKIGGVAGGVILGFILSGVLLITVAMMPIDSKWPYERFANVDKAEGVLGSPDGFVAGLISMASGGSLGSDKGFGVLHADFIDQIHLNRLKVSDGVPIVAGSKAVEVKSAWRPKEALTLASTGKEVSGRGNQYPLIIRTGIKRAAVKDGGALYDGQMVRFTMSQIRAICKNKDEANTLAGGGEVVYPVGYIKAGNIVQDKKPDDEIQLNNSDFAKQSAKWFDLVFLVPNKKVPVLVDFKQNSAARVGSFVKEDKIPATIGFVQASSCEMELAEVNPLSSANIYGVELAAGIELLNEIGLKVSDATEWDNLEPTEMGMATEFTGKKIVCTRVSITLAGERPTPRDRARQQKSSGQDRRPAARGTLGAMFEPAINYVLLSLKCNTPQLGKVIEVDQFPVLKDFSGKVHKPVGVVVEAQIGSETVYEIDYCSITDKEMTDGIVIAPDGTVSKPFPEAVWLPEEADKVHSLYFLYLVKSSPQTIVTSVQPAGSQMSAGFKGGTEGFLVK